MRTLADIKSDLATPEEVAEVLPFTVQTIQRRLRSGDIPGVKIFGRWFVNVPRLSAQLDGASSRPPAQRDLPSVVAPSRPSMSAGRADETRPTGGEGSAALASGRAPLERSA